MSRMSDDGASAGAPSAAPRARHDAVRGLGGMLDVGATLSETFGVFGRRFVPLVVLMLAIVVPLSMLLYAVGYLLPSRGDQAGLVVAVIASLIVYLIGSYLAQTAATVAVIDDLRHRPFSIGNGLRITGRRLLPVLGVTFLASMAIVLGTLLLIVPGVVLTIVFYVAVPVCAVERVGARASLSRSRFLTRGQRWRIFAVYVIVAVATGIVSRVIDGLENLIGTIPDLVLDTLWQSLTGAFGAVLTAVVYYRLRILKEGVDISAIADVFD